jgi:hypothetical protein
MLLIATWNLLNLSLLDHNAWMITLTMITLHQQSNYFIECSDFQFQGLHFYLVYQYCE